jgi:hypothetical protein
MVMCRRHVEVTPKCPTAPTPSAIPLTHTSYRSSSQLAMFSTATSSPDSQPTFDDALSDYAKQTGIDLTTHPFANTLRGCNSADAILDLFQDKARQFRAFQDGNRKLVTSLKPLVLVLHTFSGIIHGVSALVIPSNRLLLSVHVLMCSLFRYHSHLHMQFSLALMSSSRCLHSSPSSTLPI